MLKSKLIAEFPKMIIKVKLSNQTELFDVSKQMLIRDLKEKIKER